MVIFDNGYPMDFLYMRLAGIKDIFSIPLCEAIAVNGVYDPKLSTESLIVVIDPVEDGKTTKLTSDQFVSRIQKELYNGTFKIIDFVIQPGQECMTEPVRSFIERYV